MLGAALREEHAAPQLEQSWVHSSLIVSLRTAVVPGVRFLLAFLDPIWQKTFRQIRYISYHKTGKETTHGPAHISQSNLHIYKEIHWGKGGVRCAAELSEKRSPDDRGGPPLSLPTGYPLCATLMPLWCWITAAL